MFIHYLMCLVQILYTTYNLIKWHVMHAAMWVRANWKWRERFLASYEPSSEEERLDEEWMKNRAGVFRYGLKKKMLEPCKPANEDDPVWGEINKKYNVDNKHRM